MSFGAFSLLVTCVCFGGRELVFFNYNLCNNLSCWSQGSFYSPMRVFHLEAENIIFYLLQIMCFILLYANSAYIVWSICAKCWVSKFYTLAISLKDFGLSAFLWVKECNFHIYSICNIDMTPWMYKLYRYFGPTWRKLIWKTLKFWIIAPASAGYMRST